MEGALSHISLAEAGKRLGKSRTTVWRMVCEGRIPEIYLLRSGEIRPRISIAMTFFNRGGEAPARPAAPVIAFDYTLSVKEA
jgi:hypothetical protein